MNRTEDVLTFSRLSTFSDVDVRLRLTGGQAAIEGACSTVRPDPNNLQEVWIYIILVCSAQWYEDQGERFETQGRELRVHERGRRQPRKRDTREFTKQ